MTTVIYHGGNCLDGFCSAWLMKHVFQDAEFVAANYGDPPPDVTGKDVFIVDFSFPRAVTVAMARVARLLVVLNHHRTAEAELAGLRADNLTIVFDMAKSGGRIAWEYLQANCNASLFWDRGADNEPEPAESPWLVDYSEDRDLWKWELPDSREINAALRSYPLDFAEWDRLADLDPADLVPEGRAILRMDRQAVAQHVRNAGTMDIAGHVVPCVNATMLMSEIGQELSRGRPFSATWFERADGTRVYSLRSEPGGMDVSEVAKRFGGGGHTHAAGFTIPGSKTS